MLGARQGYQKSPHLAACASRAKAASSADAKRPGARSRCTHRTELLDGVEPPAEPLILYLNNDTP